MHVLQVIGPIVHESPSETWHDPATAVVVA